MLKLCAAALAAACLITPAFAHAPVHPAAPTPTTPPAGIVCVPIDEATARIKATGAQVLGEQAQPFSNWPMFYWTDGTVLLGASVDPNQNCLLVDSIEPLGAYVPETKS